MTVRTSDELLEQLRRRARHEGRSMNEYVTRVLEAAVNPDLAGDDAERTRERLARAGLLAETGPPVAAPTPPRSPVPVRPPDVAPHCPTWSAKTAGEHLRGLVSAGEALRRRGRS